MREKSPHFPDNYWSLAGIAGQTIVGRILVQYSDMTKILVIDDDTDILKILKLILKMNGFDVMVSPNAEEVIPKSLTFKPALILLDVFLAGRDGRDICNILKGNPRTKHIPVIIFSAHSSKEEVFSYCSADDFISKPFDISELVNKIRNHLPATA